MERRSLSKGVNEECKHRICMAMSNSPCLVCGQPDHALVQWKSKGDKEWTIELNCPISLHETWMELNSCRRSQLRYTFRAEKLLSKYGYCEEEVRGAFRIYETNGYGRAIRLHNPIVHSASLMALVMLCQNALYLHQFKREIKRKKEGDSDMEGDSDGNESG